MGAIRNRIRIKALAEMMPQSRRGAESRVGGNLIDTARGLLEQLFGACKPQANEPFNRRGAGPLGKASRQRSLAHPGLFGQPLDRKFLVQVPLSPIEQGGKPRAVIFRHRTLHKLCLASISVRVHDETARHLVGHVLSEVFTHDVETKIDAGGAAGRR